jgi:hypothetical protein
MAASGHDDDSFFNFDGLPTELQVMILCRVTLETLCACAQTCSRLHQLCEDEEVWSSLARRDFGTRLPPPDADFSPRIFFREMLFRNLDGHETSVPPFYHNYAKRFYLNITPRLVFS